MHHLKSIRERLGVTQQALADAIGCTQGNVGHYERGQTLPPEMAARVIAYAAERGLVIGYDHIYGSAPLPSAPGSVEMPARHTHGSMKCIVARERAHA